MATNVPNQNRILASSPVSDSMPHPLDSSYVLVTKNFSVFTFLLPAEER